MHKTYQLSPDGGYLTEASLPALRRLPARSAWLHTEMGLIKRSVSSVTLRGRKLWADRATGTLFRAGNGQCLASPVLRLQLLPQPRIKRPKRPVAPPEPVPTASPAPAATPAAPAATRSGAAA